MTQKTVITQENVDQFVMGDWKYNFEVQTCNLEVNLGIQMNGTPLSSIIHHGCVDIKTNWQNNNRPKLGAKDYESKLQAMREFAAQDEVVIDWKGKTPRDPKAATVSFLSTMNEEQMMEWIKNNVKR